MKIVGYQIFIRITRFVTLVIRPDYQKFCLRSTPGPSRLSCGGCVTMKSVQQFVSRENNISRSHFGHVLPILTAFKPASTATVSADKIGGCKPARAWQI